MNTCNRVLPFLERTLSMRNGGNHFFMGEQVRIYKPLYYLLNCSVEIY